MRSSASTPPNPPSSTRWLWALAAVAAVLGVLAATRSATAQAPDPATLRTADVGDSVSSAVELPLDASVAGVIDSATDVDVFELTVPERREVLIYTTGDLDTAGVLLDHSGLEIDSFDEAYVLTTLNNFLLWNTLDAGTYYISVSATDGDTGPYTLHTESNVNTTGFADAAPIALNSSANAMIDSGTDATDYYRLDIGTATDVLIYTTADIQNTVGALYDSGEQLLAASDDGQLQHRRSFVIRRRLDAGTHYVTVSYFLDHQSGPYTLHVHGVTEPGSSLSDAAPLPLEGAAGGNIDSPTDVDYFRIDIDESKRVEIRAASATAGINGVLLDSDGNEIADGVQAFAVGPDAINTFEVNPTLVAGTYYLRVDTSGASGLDGPASTGAYAVSAAVDVEFQRLIDRCSSDSSTVQDLLYGCQWHLSNTGQTGGTAGEDINVEKAWETTLGEGVVIAVVDGLVDPNHEDLVENLDTANSYDYFVAQGQRARPDWHGTAVAGLVAGRDNGIGIRGVAPRATIRSFNVLQAPSDINAADAASRDAEDIAVSTNSWGWRNGGSPLRAPRIWELAVEYGLTHGDSGRGTFYAWSAGNDGGSGPGFDDVNLQEYTNFYGVATVCAVDHNGIRSGYSEKGAALWVCAPSNGGSQRGGLTTVLNNGYDTFGGTSASAPIAAGVAAWVRAANPDLGWRDVKLILAASARKNDPDHGGWETGAAKYGTAGENYEFSHSYGFGVVDAGAAVELAKDWTNVGPLRSHTVTATGVPVTVGAQASDTFAESTATMGHEFAFIEFVEVNIVMSAPQVRHLEMELVSPQGAVSELLVSSAEFSKSHWAALWPSQGPFRLGSARHLGEAPGGEWTLRFRDRINGGRASTLQSWTLTVYGHGDMPSPPDITSVDGVTDPVTVSWDAPDHAGASPVTGYDLRWIRSDAADKADANWTVETDVWSSGTLEHTVVGLTAGVDYDFQVRAVNAEGEGGWSSSVTGSTDGAVNAPRFDPAETGTRSVAENTAAGVAIGDPIAATHADGDTLTYAAVGADAAKFTLDTATGQLSTKTSLDHETHSAYTFHLTATAPDGYSDTIEVTVNVTDVDEPPDVGRKRILGTPGQPQRLDSAYENDTFAPWLFVPTDPENGTLQLSLSGDDAAHFVLNDTDLDPDLLARYGPYVQLEFAWPPDFEDRFDADDNNVYDVTVEVTDGTHTTSESLQTRVLNVDEPPTLWGPATMSFAENGTDAVGELTADDPEGARLVWSLPQPAGPDDGLFELTESGTLSFKLPPDFEAPADADGDNTYEVRVQVSDGKFPVQLDIDVIVTDVDETPVDDIVDEVDADASVVWSATLTVGVNNSTQPPASGFSSWARFGVLPDRRFPLDGTTVRMLMIAQFAEGLFVIMDRPTETDFTLTLGDAEFVASESLVPYSAGRGRYWWATDGDLWAGGDEVDVSIAVGSEALGERTTAPPIAYFDRVPRVHNGAKPFTLRLEFDRELPITATTLMDHALTMTGGAVTGVSRVSAGSTQIWSITVQPDGPDDITIALPAGTACDQPGAVCTADGVSLHNSAQATVLGPASSLLR
ncbi:S8 family serine peptidase [Candidatus Poriferisodalis sp.]|uniref:S8 family serine peptidase n=1 Tax=Candidatus Poriferisodalis sp. TaxID=3101277 RepID=UPI003B02D1DA